MPSMKERHDSIPSSLRSVSYYAVGLVLLALPAAYYLLQHFFSPSQEWDWLKWLSAGAIVPLVIISFFITVNKLRDR
jgi:hypothetical protein